MGLSWKLRGLLAIGILTGCGAGTTFAPAPIPVAATSACLTPAGIHQGTNTLLLEGDAISVRAFAPRFSATSTPVFQFPFTVPGTDGNPHPRDLASDSSGRLFVDIFDDKLSGVAIYNHVTACSGSILPDGVLAGPHTGLGAVYSIAIDAQDRIYAANIVGTESQISIFPKGATGDVPPLTTIRGPKTLLGSQTASEPGFTKSVRVDSNFNVYTANSIGQITVFPAGSSGDVAPSRVIAGDKTQLVDPNIALGSDGSIYSANFEGNSITVYAPGSTGNVAPTRVISGGHTHIAFPFSVAVCSDGTMYVASRELLRFGAGSNGNVSPLAVLTVGQSGVFEPIAVGF